ncbi:ATP-binding protein [Caulobacter sp. S45]|uniref:ATP-binding protein n=1 Tax=Caulobacter sp. S45 TaxID=1641861 RepID=UPI0015774845|nr:ATP-binding protein [Caulobacter sp. S45]
MTAADPVAGAHTPSPPGRPSRHAQSLQARITAAILLTAVAVLFVGCTLFMLEQRHTEQAADHRVSQGLAGILAANEAQPFAAGDDARVARDLQVMSYFPRLDSIEARGPHGHAVVFARSLTRLQKGKKLFQAPLRWDGRVVGEVVVSISPPSGATALSHYLAMGGALFFAATALALFLGRWLAARITTPVARLSEAMEAVGSSGAFQVHVELDTADEIGRLTQCFNTLMSRLHVKDMALRRTLAELVEARDAAEAANLAKSQFLANMSHEIRTPLNGVLAMAQILARSPLEPSQREQVDVIHASGETLLSLLNDILDVSKIEAGKLELEVADFDVCSLVQAAASGFAAVAGRKGLKLDVEVADDARDWRQGDAARLRQILNNFLSNALKFTEAGSVRLRVWGDGAGGAEGLRLTVSDTGMGIPAEKVPLLFQKFTQLDASTTRRFGGTGLGLAICRELSELMDGRVWVESEPGQGSTFAVLVPLPRVAAAAQAPIPRVQSETVARPPLPPLDPMDEAAPEARPGPEVDERGALRVLAAEDNPTNQLVLTTIMQIFGVELTLASDGLEAVEAWRGGRFDVILMDIQMPRQDGVAATRSIRAEEAASGRARTPILALSANALTHQVEAYLAAGMDGHVAKPIELPKLQAALEQVLASADEVCIAA